MASRVQTRLERPPIEREPDPAPAPAEITLLGGFAVNCSGRDVSLPLSAQRLVAFLALQERPVSRSFVAGSLWADATEEHAIGSLRSALWRVRRDPTGGLVEVAGGSLTLAPAVSVDARRMSGVARCLISGDDPPRDVLARERLPAGELLPDWYDDWVVMPRERLRQLRLHGLEALAERMAGAGSYGEAVEAGLAAIEAEPLRESAHAILIRIHIAEGNRQEALRHFDRYCGVMRAGLDLGPSDEMAALVAGLTAR